MLASALVVALVLAAAAVGFLASRHRAVTNYAFPGDVARINLRLSSGQAVIVGSSSSTVQVKRTDDYAFGHHAREQRSFAGGVLNISSSCPKIVLGTCSASYELAVPETVSVNVETGSGDVRLTGFRGGASVQTRSGNVDVVAYCGFDLAATSGSGNVHVAAACAPRRLDLRTGSGDVVALVVPGRYRIGAFSGSGHERVSGLQSDPAAPFAIDAHSGSGTVTVEGGI